jgi:hypothetical protein
MPEFFYSANFFQKLVSIKRSLSQIKAFLCKVLLRVLKRIMYC